MNTTAEAEISTEQNFANLTPVQKLAAFLLIVNVESAAKIMSQLEEADLESVSAEMSKFTTISQELQTQVLEEFSPVALDAATSVRGGVGPVTERLEKSVGLFRASDIICRVAPAHTQVAAMQQIVEIEPRHLFNLLRHEQLQTVALVASYMSPERASQLLSLLRPEVREQVVERLATLAPTSIEVVENVAGMLQKKLSNNRTPALNQTGGIKVAAQVLNALPRNLSDSILASLKEQNAELGEAVSNKMFTFEDLARLDAKTLQKVMQEIDLPTLTVALKTASEKLKTTLFSCLSKRAAENVREELSFLGPLKLSQIEAAQSQVVAAVKNLESQGEIDLEELRQATA
jgi:flagellar motor switch protein FliG